LHVYVLMGTPNTLTDYCFGKNAKLHLFSFEKNYRFSGKANKSVWKNGILLRVGMEREGDREICCNHGVV